MKKWCVTQYSSQPTTYSDDTEKEVYDRAREEENKGEKERIYYNEEEARKDFEQLYVDIIAIGGKNSDGTFKHRGEACVIWAELQCWECDDEGEIDEVISTEVSKL